MSFLAWSGFADADPLVLGLVVAAVTVAALAYLARRLGPALRSARRPVGRAAPAPKRRR